MASLRRLLVRPAVFKLSAARISGLAVNSRKCSKGLQKFSYYPTRMMTAAANNKQSAEEARANEADTEEPMKEEAQSSSRTDVAKYDYDEYDDYEPKTAGEAVSMYTALGLRLLLLLAAAGCLVVTVRELFPGRLSPQSLFSEAFEVVKNHDEIRAITGDGMRAFGRDTGRNEGRRNHVDSRKYDAEDGSTRMRVRFYVQGPRGKCLVWAEVSNKMSDNEYVYLICQDMRSGRVVTVEDNRSRLDNEQLSRGPDNEIMSKISSIFGSK